MPASIRVTTTEEKRRRSQRKKTWTYHQRTKTIIGIFFISFLNDYKLKGEKKEIEIREKNRTSVLEETIVMSCSFARPFIARLTVGVSTYNSHIVHFVPTILWHLLLLILTKYIKQKYVLLVHTTHTLCLCEFV